MTRTFCSWRKNLWGTSGCLSTALCEMILTVYLFTGSVWALFDFSWASSSSSYACHEPELISQETASSSAQWSLDKLPFSFVRGQDSTMCRDQPNSRFHGRDIFREICLLPWKTPISMKFRDIRNFSWILTLLLSFMNVFNSFCVDVAVCYVSHFSTK